jgi:hypothetical protein
LKRIYYCAERRKVIFASSFLLLLDRFLMPRRGYSFGIGGFAERRLTRFAHVIRAPPVDIRESLLSLSLSRI